MIALDTSSLVAYLSGETGSDVDAVDLALEQKQGALPPVVLTELLSDPALSKLHTQLFKELPVLFLLEGYWERAGALRAKLLSRRLKAKLADCLVAQSCIDHQIPLITRDKDFRHFSKFGSLRLAL